MESTKCPFHTTDKIEECDYRGSVLLLSRCITCDTYIVDVSFNNFAGKLDMETTESRSIFEAILEGAKLADEESYKQAKELEKIPF